MIKSLLETNATSGFRVGGAHRWEGILAKRVWRVGELARESGVTVRALHHYEALGLLVASSRTSGGHRCYTQADVRRLHRIVALRSLGFPLEDIAAALRAEPDLDPGDLIREQLVLIEERIDRAAVLRNRLLVVLDGLDNAVEPSTSEFLRLIEETMTTHQPLTSEEFESLKQKREEFAQRMGSAKLEELSKRRKSSAAEMSRAEHERLRDNRARITPPDIETAAIADQ
nr:MerR family transcriptional regulator [Rhodococcus fascians]